MRFGALKEMIPSNSVTSPALAPLMRAVGLPRLNGFSDDAMCRSCLHSFIQSIIARDVKK
jgi:hypothetical protein